MMADIGLDVCAGGGQVEGLVVECFQYIRISCIFDKRSIVSLEALEQGRRWNVSTLHTRIATGSRRTLSHLRHGPAA
jgi:hypothetical protein